MPPTLTPPVKKKTVGDLAAGSLTGISAVCDFIKFLLFFLDALPLAGIPLSFLGTLAVSIFELFTVTLGLYISGAFKGKNSSTALLITFMEVVMGMTPFLDNLPETTMGTLMIIVRSRVNDEIEYKEAVAKYEKDLKAANDNEAIQERALVAAQNAAATAASDTEGSRFSARAA